MGTYDISVLSKPLSGLLTNFREFLPGIPRLLAIYYDDASRNIQCRRITLNKGKVTNELMGISDNQGEIVQMRSEKIPFTWMGKDSIPFEIEEKKRNHIDIFSELQNMVLLLRLYNNDDNRYDLLFLYFDEKSTQFWLTGSGDALDTTNKQIIGQLLYQSVGFYLRSMSELNDSLVTFKKLTQQSLAEYKSYKDKYDHTRNNYRKSIQNLSNHYISRISQESAMKFELSEDALAKLGEFSGDISRLEEILRQAAVHAEMLSPEMEGKELIIHDWCIHLDNATTVKPYTEQEVNRYDRTIHLLDRLENAARIVVSKKLRLTGTNVGKFCDHPISAPAITDALKNHKNKIRYLAGQYPQKWITIRSAFRPVINALERNLRDST